MPYRLLVVEDDANAAEFVCKVPKTRCPVSAAVTASEMVSRSRISPTRIRSGSWRNTCLSAAANERVSEPSSRWRINER